MKKRYLLSLLALVPFTALAAGELDVEGNRLVMFLQDIILFIDQVLVPLIFAIAFIVFLWGIFQYFIAGGANEEQRDKGKQFAIWGIVGFFVMVSIWGIVNLFTNTFGFGGDTRPDLPTFNQGQKRTTSENNNGVIFPNGGDGTENDYAPTGPTNTGTINTQTGLPEGQTGTEADYYTGN